MHRQHVQRILPFRLATRCHRLAQPGLGAVIVAARIERELGVALRAIGPAGQHARQLGHVFLGIAAVDAQGMQLHQLAGVILIQTASLRDPVIEVEQHGRMMGRGAQHLAERAKHVGTDRIALVTCDQGTVLPFTRKYIEVVIPEVNHHFFQLARAFDGAQQAGFGRFGGHLLHHFPALALLATACFLESFQRIAGAHLQRFQLVQPLG